MKFTCADFTFPLLSNDQVFALLKLLEFGAVDLGIFAGRSHLQPFEILRDGPGAVRRMNESLERNHLVASDVFLQTGPEPSVHAANDPHHGIRMANREIFRGVLEFAAGIGCQHLTGLPGVWHERADRSQDWDLAVEEAAWRKAAAAKAGIEYAVEAHVGSLLPDPESALRFVKESGTSLTLDYGHFVYQGMASSAADILLPHATHFHARGGCHGQLQSTVKDNTIDFPDIVRQLKQLGYKGWFCLEYVWVDWEGCNRTDNISESLLLRDILTRA